MATDNYTEDVLRECYGLHLEYVKVRKAYREKTGLDIRLPNVPEDISENIAKFIIRNKLGDETCRWTKSVKKTKENEDATKGDLISRKEGRQECKCFTSDGPASFGPEEAWDVIYFLDMRKWLENHFVLYRVPLKNTDAAWQNIVMDARGEVPVTFGDQCKKGVRPRKCWELLHPQITAHVHKVFEGTFEDIFVPTPPLSQATSTSPKKFVFRKSPVSSPSLGPSASSS